MGDLAEGRREVAAARLVALPLEAVGACAREGAPDAPVPDLARVAEQFVDRRVEALVRGAPAPLVPVGSGAVGESPEVRAGELAVRETLRQGHVSSVAVIEVGSARDQAVIRADEHGALRRAEPGAPQETSWRMPGEFTFTRHGGGRLLTGQRPTECGAAATTEPGSRECG